MARLVGTANWQQVSVTGGPSPREGHCSFVFGSRIFIFGGSVESELAESSVVQANDLWCYDSTVGQWAPLATSGDVPSPRTGACAAVIGSRAFVFGGLALSHECPWLSELHCLDLNTLVWTDLRAAPGRSPSPRDKAACVTLGNRMVVFGGFGPSGTPVPGATEATFEWFNDLHVFNAETMAWEPVVVVPTDSAAPAKRCAMAMAAFGINDAVIFGGRTNLGARANDVWRLNLAAAPGQHVATWQFIQACGDAPEPRSFPSAVAWGAKLIVFGGRAADNRHIADVHVLSVDFAGPFWALVNAPNKPEPRGFHTAVVVGNSMVVFGGSTDFSPSLNAATRYFGDLLLLDLATLCQ